MANIGINPCKCKKCGHEWLSHSVSPKACARCGSWLWNSYRVYRGETLEEKFLHRVNKTESCWLWTGWINAHGYGQLKFKKGKGSGMFAHRLSWQIHYGIIPEGLCVLHRCDNRRCVRPEHLFLGTIADNNRDCVNKKRNQRGERHGNAVLTWSVVCEARKLKSQGGITNREIGKQLGISESHLWQILTWRIWKDSGDIPNLSSP